MNTYIFTFSDLNQKNKVVKKIVNTFKKNGITIIEDTIDVSKIKRTSGINYKELTLTTTESHQIQFSIKQSGDIFKVKIGVIGGGKQQLREMPIKNQDDQAKAIAEICNKLKSERVNFQKKLAKLQANEIDPKIKDKMKKAVRNQVKALQAELDTIDKQIAEADKKILALQESVK